MSKGTLRQWMTEDGLRVPHARLCDSVHQPRRRRASDRFGPAQAACQRGSPALGAAHTVKLRELHEAQLDETAFDFPLLQACDAEPTNLEYQALFAWLYVQGIELKPGREADEVLGILTRALRQHRENLELRMYRGRLLQRLGRADDAIRDFSVVASMDPNNVDAAREVRLHRMRSEQQRSPSGVFSKLFTR